MGIVVVDVMLKSEILDPQGQAVAGALPRLGFNQFTDVRQGKRFELTVDGEVTDEVLAAAREAAETMLSNPVIEDVVNVSAQTGLSGSPVAGPPATGSPAVESDVEFLA
jgi:phosphoribosylformylglycinamidine synthase PurS subunit